MQRARSHGTWTCTEGYHFKDTGHLTVYPRPNEKLNDPQIKECVPALGVQHMKN